MPKVFQRIKDPLPGVYTIAMRAETQTDMNAPVFLIALSTIAKRQEPPKCPSRAK